MPATRPSAERWLSVAAGQIAYGPAAARLITVFGSKSFVAEEVIARAHGILQLIDAELQHSAFIVGDHPTIADVAIYSYIARAPEGNVDLKPYAAITNWLHAIESLPGYVEFARTPVGMAA